MVKWIFCFIQLIIIHYVSSSTLQLSLIDKFGDGWADAALMVVTPSEELGALSPSCDKNPLNMDIEVTEDGLYYFIVSNTGDESVVQNPWEIFWTINVLDSAEEFSGGYNTTLVLDYNSKSKKPWSLVYWENMLPKESTIKSCSKGQFANTKTCSKSSAKKVSSPVTKSNMDSSTVAPKESKTGYDSDSTKSGKGRRNKSFHPSFNVSTDMKNFQDIKNKSYAGSVSQYFSISQVYGVATDKQFFSGESKSDVSPEPKKAKSTQSYNGEHPLRGRHKSTSRSLTTNAGDDSNTPISGNRQAERGILSTPVISTSKGTTDSGRQNLFIRAVVSKAESDQNQREKGSSKSPKGGKKGGIKNSKTPKGKHFGKHDSNGIARQVISPTKRKDKSSLQLQVTMYDTSGNGWKRGYFGTTFYISDDKMESLMAFGSLESGSYSGICSYCIPEGSYFFRVAGAVDSDSLTDVKWDFCNVEGLPSQQLSFHVEDGVCVPDALVDLDTICYGTISSYVTVSGTVGLYGLKAAVLEHQETILVENALKAVISGWGNAVFTTTTSMLELSKEGLGAKLQFSVIFDAENAFDVDGLCYSAVNDLVSDIGSSLNETITNGRFKKILQNIGEMTKNGNFDHVSDYVFEGLVLSGISYSGAKGFSTSNAGGSEGAVSYSSTETFTEESVLSKQPLVYHHVLIVFSLVCISVAGFLGITYGFSSTSRDKYSPALDKSEDESFKSGNFSEISSKENESMNNSTDSANSTSFVMSVSYLINETNLVSAARVKYDESVTDKDNAVRV